MPTTPAAHSIAACQRFFATSTACFQEQDATFTPVPGAFTVAQHVAHAGQTIDWFIDGMFSPTGFSSDWPAMEAAVRRIASLEEARMWFARSCAAAIARLDATDHAEMLKPMAAGEIMGGLPRMAALNGITDHTAHHRGALTVYARLLGRTPAMPYA